MKQSYIEQVKNILEERGHITTWGAITELGNTRLSSTIYELRHKYYMKINMEMRTAYNWKRYCYYYLVKEDA